MEATFREARWPEDLELVRGMFGEYRSWLADHRDPASEAASRVREGLALVDRLTAELSSTYTPPRGSILLWFEGDQVVACGAIRSLDARTAEARRIFIRPDYRGKTFGMPFVRALTERTRSLGYPRLRVDTLPSMTAAIEFYQASGFRRIPAFWPHPVAEALFFEGETGRSA